MQFFDRLSLGQPAEIAGARTMRNGAMIVQARAARSGNVQVYAGAEVQRPDLPIVRVYRDADEIFRADSLRTFGHKPVTVDHPTGPVTSQTWRQVARGHVGEEVVRDGEFVRIPMMLADAEAISAAKTTHGEVSVGYTCDLDWTPGTAPDGQSYDARQVKVIVDHVAIVPKGRAGPECRLGDEHPSDHGSMKVLSPLPQTKEPAAMRTHLIDGHSVELSDAAAIAVANLQKQIATLEGDNLRFIGDAKKAADTILAKDAEIATHRTAVETKDGEIAVLRQQLADAQMTPAKLDAAVAARAAVIGAAKTVLGDGYKADGKTEVQIRRDAVALRMGDAATAMSDAAIDGAFAALTAGVPAADPVRNAFVSGLQTSDAASPEARAAAAHAKRIETLRNAYKAPAAA